MKIEHRTSASGGVFFIEHDGSEAATMEYKTTGEGMVIEHTNVDAVFKGQGVGKKLVSAAVAYAAENKKELGATCSFARAVLEKEDGYRNIYNSHLK